MSKQVTNIVRQKQEPAKRFRHNMFTYFTREQFISFSNWLTGASAFDEKKYEQWLHGNYDLWHNPMPPIYAIDEMVSFTPIIGEPSIPVPARINAVHIYRNGNKYDIELHLQNDLKERLHNVSPIFLERLISVSVENSSNYSHQEQKQRESTFVVRLKAHVEKCMIKSGAYDEHQKLQRDFMDSLGEGAVDALKVGDCVQKYIPEQNKNTQHG